MNISRGMHNQMKIHVKNTWMNIYMHKNRKP